MTVKLRQIKAPSRASDDRLSAPLLTVAIKDEVTAKDRLAEFLAVCDRRDVPTDGFQANPLADFLAAVFESSPHLFALAKNYPQALHSCLTSGFAAATEQALAPLDAISDDEKFVMQSARQAKGQVALITGLADLGGWWPATSVGEVMSRTADACLKFVTSHLLLSAHQSGKITLKEPNKPWFGCGYAVLAMGKHGAFELNYSSDIDLIVVFDPDAGILEDPLEGVAVFNRITRSLVRIMQDRTEHGYAFRTDLRLRPDPGSMPLAIPLPLAMHYYEARGQNWERAALIKARPVAGDFETGEEFVAGVSPFIWRRYLDYSAIADVHSIKRQIQAHRDLGELNPAGHNVKLGRGGIREIEFFVQTQQLIAGGRMPELRHHSTLEMLARLQKSGWISEQVCSDLTLSYHFLRDVEHRLQMVSDNQTHTVPTDKRERETIATLCGYRSLGDFERDLLAHLRSVETHYENLFSNAPDLSNRRGNLSFSGDESDPGTIDTLREMDFQDPQQVITTVKSWHFGRYPAMQSSEARERLTEITPLLLHEISQTGRADEVLRNFDAFLKGLPAGFQLFTLLHTNPRLLILLVRILGAAPRLARIITRRPHVFDGLLEPGFFEESPNREQLVEALNRSMDQAHDYEQGLDLARIFLAEQKFLIGIRVLGGSFRPGEAGLAYSQLAEVVLNKIVQWVQTAFEDQHGKVPNSQFSIMALGKLAARELAADSDLDLVFIYAFDPDFEESDGRRPLHASQYYGRLAQRLIAAMGAPTSEGTLYELDFRLRPGGSKGPIATSLMALSRYDNEDAWTWELMALTRARLLSGSEQFKSEIEKVIDDALDTCKPVADLAKDVLDMRRLMDEERPPKSNWDIKLSKGGQVDLEFLCQFEILSKRADRRQPFGKILSSFPALSLQNDNVTLSDVLAYYSDITQLMRTCLDGNTTIKEAPPGLVEMLIDVMGLPDYSSASEQLREYQRAVRKSFLNHLRKA